MTTINAPTPADLLRVLGEGERWTQGVYEKKSGTEKFCLHGAIRACCPEPGDAHIIEKVASRNHWGTGWNDDPARTWDDVRGLIESGGVSVTDEELAETFGPQWREIVALVQRTAVLTQDEVSRLAAAWGAAGDAACPAAAGALVIRDLIGQHGFTQEHYDALTGPWREVIGPVHPDDQETTR